MARRKAQENPRYYTTFQVAQLLGVSAPAVVNWTNDGLLAAHRTPGGHRRIARDDLVAFARTRGLPLPPALDDHSDGRLRVLVVDDQVDFCEMIREFLLLKGGFQVETANSGFAAGLAVARLGPDVILMDLMMPDMDGFDVLRRLRRSEETRGIPVVACTGYRDPEIERRIDAEGFDSFLEKPLRLEALVETLRDLGRPRVRLRARR